MPQDEPLPRDRDVLQPVLEQPDDLVAADGGLDPELARADQLEQLVAVAAQPEEVVALLRRHQLERRMLDAVAVDDLRRLLELLAARRSRAPRTRHVEVVGVALLRSARAAR